MGDLHQFEGGWIGDEIGIVEVIETREQLVKSGIRAGWKAGRQHRLPLKSLEANDNRFIAFAQESLTNQ